MFAAVAQDAHRTLYLQNVLAAALSEDERHKRRLCCNQDT